MKKTAIVLAAVFLLAGCATAPTTDAPATGSSSAAETSTTTRQTTAVEAPSEPAGDDSAQGVVTATFKVTTSAEATVMWGTTAGMSQVDIKKGDWSKELELNAVDAAMVMVTAVDFEKSQSVTCEILINGVSRSKNTGEGKTANATCDATVLN